MTRKTATAAVVEARGKRPRVHELPIPALAGGAAVVRVSASTLCGTDVKIWRDGINGVEFPYVVGHEAMGVIEKMSTPRRDVAGVPLHEGQRVLWSYGACGTCYYCSVSLQPNLCETSVRFGRGPASREPHLLGSCATHHYVPATSRMIRVPAAVPDGLAASAACALRTVMHGFEALGGLASHETVLVQGSGAVGLYATAVALSKGVAEVLVVGAPTSRLRIAEELGATAVFELGADGDVGQRLQWVRDHTQGRGADVVLQCASTAALPETLDLVRKGGRVVSIGGGGSSLSTSGRQFTTGITLRSIRSAAPRHFLQAMAFLDHTDRRPLEKMLSAAYPLSGVGTALDRLAALEHVKPVVVPDLPSS